MRKSLSQLYDLALTRLCVIGYFGASAQIRPADNKPEIATGYEKLDKTMTPDYGGTVFEAHEIRYDEIDLPLRRLVRLINSTTWVRSYGCCAGPAFHGHSSDVGHQFFIGLFIDSDNGGIDRLRSLVTQANRLNGSTGLCAEVENVHKHPLGQGSVDGWLAYRLAARDVRGRQVPPRPAVFLRLIECLESAWEGLWSPSVGDR